MREAAVVLNRAIRLEPVGKISGDPIPTKCE
jgi:hypothetical protein